ncbi:MAG: hypothetical protein EZS28_030232 [Streblomastix strix]|uniref:NrS-1 polymerase-like helicase domain-containing protein n=1 Tax=Streblomastix strix TaxID=222440 RepID=A0A5J4UUX7_9EUKA|nr:MAG: hypothetical protein EZS28_030232 [Streblomastix strix]
MYFDLIKETIAAGDERVYEYILNWMAWLIQNPEKKSKAAIQFQGRQKIGKNRIIDVIAEPASRYSYVNIRSIDEFSGKFISIVENKMFAVTNDMMIYKESKNVVATVMHSIISDLTIRINEKNLPGRTAENVMNIIYVTKADMTDQLDTEDRRHLFKQGIPIALVNQCKPSNWLLKTYINAMIHKCSEQKLRINAL